MLCINEDCEEVLKRSLGSHEVLHLSRVYSSAGELRNKGFSSRAGLENWVITYLQLGSTVVTHHAHNCHPDMTTPTFQFRTSRTFPERVPPAFRQAPLAGISHKANETSRQATFRPFQPNEAGKSDKQFDEQIQTPALARKSQEDKGGMPDSSSSNGDIN